jgi:hypothetical protein
MVWGGYGGFCRIGTVPVLLYAGEDDRFSLNALLKFRHLSLLPSGGIFLSAFVCLVKNLPDKKRARSTPCSRMGWRRFGALMLLLARQMQRLNCPA